MDLDEAMRLVREAAEELRQVIGDVNAEGIGVYMNITDPTLILLEPTNGPWRIQVSQRKTEQVGGS